MITKIKIKIKIRMIVEVMVMVKKMIKLKKKKVTKKKMNNLHYLRLLKMLLIKLWVFLLKEIMIL
jgi:hypothetical protein